MTVMAEADRITRGRPERQGKNIPASTRRTHHHHSGMSMIQNANGSNFGAMFVILEEFEHRHGASLSAMRSRPSCAASISDASRMAAWRYSARPPSTAWAMQAGSR